MAKKQVNYDALNALLQFKTTKGFCADYLGMSEDTLERRIKDDHGMVFTAYHQLKQGRMAIKLQQKAIDMAFSGNTTLMIFALKNLAGWVNETEITANTESIKLVIEGMNGRD